MTDNSYEELNNGINTSEDEDLRALKNFLLDIDCLNPLSEWTSKFNLFDILKITRAEIRHSNVLSWLINPNENHGLGDSVIRGFIQYACTFFTTGEEIFDVLLMDYHSFSVYREWHYIDILAVSTDEKMVLCIENKVDSKEHDDQLNRYRNLIETTYPDYKKAFIYLSPEGDEPSDPENWLSMSYGDVLDIIDNSRKKVKLLPESELLIQNYIDTIRRDILKDDKLAQICADIYTKHQRALDLIFENRPDKASELADIFMSWAKEKTEEGIIEVVPSKCVKSYTRFKTKGMSIIMPDANEAASGWGTRNHYFYEIRNLDGKEFFIQLALSSKNIPDDLRAVCDRINDIHPSRQQKDNWQWRTPVISKHTKVGEEMTEDVIKGHLDKHLKEILEIESQMIEQLQK